MQYLGEHQHRMRYAELRRDDLDIETGAVEGAVRNLVGMRLDGPGMRSGVGWLRVLSGGEPGGLPGELASGQGSRGRIFCLPAPTRERVVRRSPTRTSGSCRLAGVNPVEYLADVLPKLARGIRPNEAATLVPATWRARRDTERSSDEAAE
jgi:hypothetical protein